MRGVQTGRCGGARPGEGEGLVVGEADGQQIPCSDAAPHRRHLGLGTLVLVTAHIGSQRFDIVN
jgi:hypothetical protein